MQQVCTVKMVVRYVVTVSSELMYVDSGHVMGLLAVLWEVKWLVCNNCMWVWLQAGMDFVITMSKLAVGPTQWLICVIFLEHEAEQLPPYSDKIKNVWSFTFIAQGMSIIYLHLQERV
jgi:hypothetical protein